MHGGRDHPGLSQDHSVYARRRYSDAGDAACLQAMSIFRLRDLCVSEGLDPRGGKEECVRRLEGAYGGQDAMLRDVQAQHVAQHALDMDAMSYQELIDLGAELGAVPKGISQAELEDLSVTHTVRAADLPALAGASCSVCLQSFVEEEKVCSMVRRGGNVLKLRGNKG